MTPELDPLTLRTEQSEGKTVLIPMMRDYRADLFGTAYLAAHHEEPLNTRRARFQALANFRLASIVGGIERPEQRLSYQTGLTEPELSAVNLLIRHTHDDLNRLADMKAQGVDFTNLEAALSKFEPASNATRINRATYVIAYLEWLMKTGNRVLTRHVVSDRDNEMRRQARLAIRELITKPTEPGRVKRTLFTGYALAKLEEHMETYDPASIWKDRLTALRNSTMFELQYYGSLRRSEVLALKWEDITPGRGTNYPPEILVADRRDDPQDPRKYKPEAKTGSGVVTVPDAVFRQLDEAWREAWDEINDLAEEIGVEANMDHTFVFVTTTTRRPDVLGSPLSLAGFDAASRTLCAGCGFTNGEATSHALRHLCAMRYVRRRRTLGDSEEQIEKGMREFFRWSLTSDMPSYYTAHEDHAAIYADMVADARFINEM
ncbi:hypothetical protein NBRC116599_29520 [Aquicoccus sp. SU-CL01552]